MVLHHYSKGAHTMYKARRTEDGVTLHAYKEGWTGRWPMVQGTGVYYTDPSPSANIGHDELTVRCTVANIVGVQYGDAVAREVELLLRRNAT